MVLDINNGKAVSVVWPLARCLAWKSPDRAIMEIQSINSSTYTPLNITAIDWTLQKRPL